jgi:Mg/Co/Ni transporter MgtE
LKAEVSELQDVEHAKDIVDLLRYDEDTAGGIMHKELVKVNENWNVLTCVKKCEYKPKIFLEFIRFMSLMMKIDSKGVCRSKIY